MGKKQIERDLINANGLNFDAFSDIVNKLETIATMVERRAKNWIFIFLPPLVLNMHF